MSVSRVPVHLRLRSGWHQPDYWGRCGHGF